MKYRFFITFFALFFIANLSMGKAASQSFVFNNYWMDGFSTGYAPNLDLQSVSGMNSIIVSFADMNDGDLVIFDEEASPSVPLSQSQIAALKSEISTLNNAGTQVWIALGGANGSPIWDDTSLTPSDAANKIATLASQFSATGIDFDYESYSNTQNLYNIIVMLRQNYPTLQMSFTFASGGPGITTPPYNTLPGGLTSLQVTTPQGKQNIFAALWPYMKYFNLMNYNQGAYCPPSTSWTATPAVIQAPWEQTGYWNANAYVDCFYYAVQSIMSLTGFSQQQVSQKLMNGINIGYDGVNSSTISPQLVANITTEAKNNGLAGVFTWCLNRDYPGQGYRGDNSGTNNPPGAYSLSIVSSIEK